MSLYFILICIQPTVFTLGAVVDLLKRNDSNHTTLVVPDHPGRSTLPRKKTHTDQPVKMAKCRD